MISITPRASAFRRAVASFRPPRGLIRASEKPPASGRKTGLPLKTNLILGAVLVALAGSALAAPAGHPFATINGFTDGPTPFISFIDLTISPPDGLKRITFAVAPKSQSLTRPISATYSSAYLQGRGYLDPLTGHLTLPVFGLYADHDNGVGLTTDFRQGPSQRDTVPVMTQAWTDPTGGIYANPTVVQARAETAEMSYDYIMLKGFAAPISPVIIDTDGEVRWVGTSGIASIPSMLFENGIYISNGSGITRMELDGTHAPIANYAGIGVTNAGHHNYDPGKEGILVEVDTTAGVESTILEVDGAGAVLRTWKFADIVSDAMIAGGDDPSAFVNAGIDWFHNNAATYDPKEDALIASAREDFVISVDYETGAINWILGDPTKAWHQYPSLVAYELQLSTGSLPPLGQHAVSITRSGDLLLFDNGRGSLNHVPIGEDRSYSAPRKYSINSRKMTATEIWRYEAAPSLLSQYCSSVYEHGRGEHLANYTLAGDLIALDADDQIVFHYNLTPAAFCGVAWNAIPIHLENVEYP